MAAIRNLQKSTEPFKPHNMTSIPNGQSRLNTFNRRARRFVKKIESIQRLYCQYDRETRFDNAPPSVAGCPRRVCMVDVPDALGELGSTFLCIVGGDGVMAWIKLGEL